MTILKHSSAEEKKEKITTTVAKVVAFQEPPKPNFILKMELKLQANTK